MPNKCQGNAKDCQENAKNMHRKCQENVRKTWGDAKETLRVIRKCNYKQHKHPVPAKHEEETLKYMESFENYGTYKGMLRKLTTIPSKCQEHALEMPRKCHGNAKEIPRTCKNALRNTWKCDDEQHKHPAPAKHEEEVRKIWNPSKIMGRMLECWINTKQYKANVNNMHGRCCGNAKEMQRKC